MATFWISEYSDLGHSGGGRFAQVALEPAVATQTNTFTTATASAAFNTATKLVGIRADALAHLVFGIAPVATASHKPISAGETHYFAVEPGQKVSFYDGTS